MERPWLAAYDVDVRHSIEYPDESLDQMLDNAVREHGDSVAMLFMGRRTSYRQLGEQVDRFATGLIRAGFEPGERLALMLPNMPQFLVAFYGALRAGLTVVPTNPLYRPRELIHQLEDSGASAIVALPSMLATVLPAIESTAVRLVIVAQVSEALPWHLDLLFRLKTRGQSRAAKKLIRSSSVAVTSWKGVMAQRGAAPRSGKPGDIAVLQYTGGTTGASKGAMLTHRNLIANAMQVFQWQGKIPQRVMTLCVAPFFHVYGLTVGMNGSVGVHGGMLLVPRFEAEAIRKTICKYRPNLFPGIPTMYLALSALPGITSADFASLDICISGAAPLPAEVQNRFAKASPSSRLVEGYGLTEAGPVTHCNPLNRTRPGSVGVPFPDTDAAIVALDGWNELPSDEVGEVIVRGPQVMLGYWQRPDETQRVMNDGWLRTGDLGYQDNEGYFYIVDRIKDVIIAGGYNIYPREIEEVLFRHAAVLEACVIGSRSEYRGETVKAFIVLRPAATATTDSIIGFCKEELAAYKVPTVVEFVDELPKSLVGKVLRRRLRELDTAAASLEPAADSTVWGQGAAEVVSHGPGAYHGQ